MKDTENYYIKIFIAQPSSPPLMSTINSGQQPPGLDWVTIIVAVLTGTSAGFLSALLTPWAQFAVDIRKDERKNIRIIVEHLQDFIHAQSEILDLTEAVYFQEFILRLSPSIKHELFRLIDEYDKQLKHFLEVELPDVRRKAKKDLESEKKFIEKAANLTLAPSAQGGLLSEYVSNIIFEKKQELAKPLRVFLAKQLAILKKRYRL